MKLIDQYLKNQSNFSIKDFCRYLLVLKTNLNLGDVFERNGFSKYININPSMYDINKTIEKLSNTKTCCRVFKFNVCDEGSCIISKTEDGQSRIPCIHKKMKKCSDKNIDDRIFFLKKSNFIP